MARRDLSKVDASDNASSELEYVIRRQVRVAEPVVPSVAAGVAMRQERIAKTVSNRDVTRVLFISRNSELLNPAQQTLDGYIDISELFDEVHILILRQGIPPKNPVLRVSHNVWIYTASAKAWWATPFSGIQMAKNQLEFASGFRPDLIVARDPFESAVVALKLAKKYKKPTQLHVLEDFSTSEFVQRSKHNFWRLFLPFFTLPRFSSVRTLTGTIQAVIQKKFIVKDVDTLPRYQDYEGLIDLKTELDLKEKYRPLIFFILYIGKLDDKSSLNRVMDASHWLLRNPRVGLIVLGDGPRKGIFVERSKLLGIEKQVVFETRAKDPIPYLKSANILVVSDTTPDSEELVLKGAAAGIPMIMSRTEKREDTFVDGESAFLCEQTDTDSFTVRINDLLNDVGLRRQFTLNTQDIIREKFHSDPSEYRSAYRTSIEQAFFTDIEESEEEFKAEEA
ncbi:glycosyltransferase [Candidatus Nomurabacteria bacterium]|nr:glycosyltransferase [Candidatus Kaiserbacteria bacterium]MCB9815105.1 glycosyltransferase [Candidatus Nomurabacteria bacterium]